MASGHSCSYGRPPKLPSQEQLRTSLVLVNDFDDTFTAQSGFTKALGGSGGSFIQPGTRYADISRRPCPGSAGWDAPIKKCPR